MGFRRASAVGAKGTTVLVYIAASFAVTIVALTAVVTYTSRDAFEREREHAMDRARSAAELVAIGYAREIDEIPASADAILDVPELAALDLGGCNRFMQRYIEWPHGHLSFMYRDGAVVCSSDPRALRAVAPYAGEEWLRRAIAGERITLTPATVDPITGTVSVASVVPFRTTSGRRAVFYMLSEMPNFLTLTQPEIRVGTEIVVLDEQRSIILDRSIDGDRYRGVGLAGQALALDVPAEGATLVGVDGVERVYAEEDVEGAGWHVLSGIPTATAFVEARAQRARSVGLGAGSIVLVAALGLVLHRRLVRPVRHLTKAIEAAAEDPDTIAPESGPAEIARVAEAFNEMNERRRRSEQRFRSLVLHASDMIAVLDDVGNVGYSSPAVERLLGVDERAAVDRSLSSFVVEPDRERLAGAFRATLRRPGATESTEVRMRAADGTIRQVEILLNNLLDDPAVRGLVATVHDITDRKAFEEHLAHQALHDPLTDLPNRALVLDRLAHALARAERTGGRVGVLFMDLDRFKLINDTHGHGVGDRVLVMVADRLVLAIRASDTIARFGGDEFVAVCENVANEEEAMAFADRMASALKDAFIVGEQELFLSGSVGIALSGDGEDAEQLLSQADAAMYRAKERGRAGYALFDEGMRGVAASRLQVEAALHRAISADSFVLHYQPKISLSDGRLVGAEALIRMVGSDGVLVPPGDFIDVAEDTGLIVPIGEIVLRKACEEARRWRDVLDLSLPISVNLSPRQLAQPRLPEMVERTLAETSLPPEMLILEITENLLMQDAVLAAEALERLRGLGVRISIDDFGTGHSSLGYLRTFPIDELKIDRSFVHAIETDPRSTTIISSVVGLAHGIGLTVVAEGIETAAQLSELRTLGCDVGQGFYFSHPRPASSIIELVTSSALWGAELGIRAG